MHCMHCNVPSGGEHMVSCSLYEPPLTQDEIRALRRILRPMDFAGRSVNPQVSNPHSAPETAPRS